MPGPPCCSKGEIIISSTGERKIFVGKLNSRRVAKKSPIPPWVPWHFQALQNTFTWNTISPPVLKMEFFPRGAFNWHLSLFFPQQLIGIRARKAELVSWYEDPDRPGRLRLLGGTDPSQSELWIILGKLEKRLGSKEEDLSEKNLTYEAICRLVDALRVRTDANR